MMKRPEFLYYFSILIAQIRASEYASSDFDRVPGLGSSKSRKLRTGTLPGYGTESSATELSLPTCEQPSSIQGNGRASIGRWSWHSNTDTCRYFIYSGFDGNDNNFKDAEDCFNECGSENTDFDIEMLLIDIYGEDWDMNDGALHFREKYRELVGQLKATKSCQKPKAVAGTCYDSIGKWTFDAKTDSCEYFEYSGCEGNENNFDNLQTCFQQCGSENTTLVLAKLLKKMYGSNWKNNNDANQLVYKIKESFKELKIKKFPQLNRIRPVCIGDFDKVYGMCQVTENELTELMFYKTNFLKIKAIADEEFMGIDSVDTSVPMKEFQY